MSTIRFEQTTTLTPDLYIAGLTDSGPGRSVAQGEHEKRQGGEYDVNWPAWYAACVVAEQARTKLPT